MTVPFGDLAPSITHTFLLLDIQTVLILPASLVVELNCSFRDRILLV